MSTRDEDKRDQDALDPERQGKLRRSVGERARGISDEDIKRLLERERELEEKARRLPGKFERLIAQVKLLFEVVRAYWKGDYREIPWSTVAMSVVALVYFLSPLDMIADYLPGLGYIDDAFVIGIVIASVKEDLKKYCEHMGYELERFF